MFQSIIFISTLVIFGASTFYIEDYEKYFRSQIESEDRIVFYFHGNIYLNFISSDQLSVQQLTTPVNFKTPIPNLVLRYFNPSNVIISDVDDVFLSKTNAGYVSMKKLFWATQTLAIFFDKESSYRSLVLDCNKAKRNKELCKIFEKMVQSPSLKFVSSFPIKNNKKLIILCNGYCLDTTHVLVQLRFSKNKILYTHTYSYFPNGNSRHAASPFTNEDVSYEKVFRVGKTKIYYSDVSDLQIRIFILLFKPHGGY